MFTMEFASNLQKHTYDTIIKIIGVLRGGAKGALAPPLKLVKV